MKQQSNTGPRGERRGFGRRETFKPAFVRSNEDGAMFETQAEADAAAEVRECIITNESKSGVLLSFRDSPDVPDQFDLVLQEEDKLIACRVAYRAGNKLGVQFISLPRRASLGDRQLRNHSEAVSIIARDF